MGERLERDLLAGDGKEAGDAEPKKPDLYRQELREFDMAVGHLDTAYLIDERRREAAQAAQAYVAAVKPRLTLADCDSCALNADACDDC